MKKILYYILLIYYELEYLLIRLIPSKQENTVLLLRTDNIGDFILWLDSAKQYKLQYDKKITLLCNSSFYELAVKFPYFDEVISFDEKKLLFNLYYRLTFFISLAKRNFDKVINPLYSRDYFLNDITVRNLKSTEKIGFNGNFHNTVSKLRGLSFSIEKANKMKNKLIIKGNKFYTHLIDAEDNIVMELKRNTEFISKLFKKEFKSSIIEWPFEIKRKDNMPEKYVVVFIGASSMTKVWQKEKYAYIINNIKQDVVILGGKNDVVIFNNIYPLINKDKKIINLVGKTSLMDLFSIIKYADFMLTNDTVASHIAPIVKTKSIVLLSGSYYGRFHPYETDDIEDETIQYFPIVANHYMDCYNCNNICIKSKDKTIPWQCISTITTDEVLKKIDKINIDLNNIKK